MTKRAFKSDSQSGEYSAEHSAEHFVDHFVEPGEMHFSTSGEEIETLLGSCISVCVYDQALQAGGLIHYILPEPPGGSSSSTEIYKYGVTALPGLLKKFKALGSKPNQLVAKVFGGARVVDGVEVDIGKLNIELARQSLAKFGIPIVVEDVGGTQGRRIRFNSRTGKVMLQKMRGREQALAPAAPKASPPYVLPPKVSAIKLPTVTKKVRVLIVDDSGVVRRVLKEILSADERIEIVGEAANAAEAEEMRGVVRPQVMTLDIHMPGKDGVTFLRELMERTPLPVIMVTDYNLKETGPVMQALELGAFDHVKKPGIKEIGEIAEDLCEKIVAASKVKLSNLKIQKGGVATSHAITKSQIENTLVVVGASTGGTEALKDILIRLPKDIPAMVVVQHMPVGFTKIFADRLNAICAFPVKEAETGDAVKPGHVYLAKGGVQMRLVEGTSGITLALTDDPPVNRFKPSVDYLFFSALKVKSKKIVAVLLTGMGADGALGMVELKRENVYTIAQDEDSSVVYGMPKAAFEMGGVSLVASLKDMPNAMLRAIGR